MTSLKRLLELTEDVRKKKCETAEVEVSDKSELSKSGKKVAKKDLEEDNYEGLIKRRDKKKQDGADIVDPAEEPTTPITEKKLKASDLNKFDEVIVVSKKVSGVVYSVKGNEVSVRTSKGVIKTTPDDLILTEL